MSVPSVASAWSETQLRPGTAPASAPCRLCGAAAALRFTREHCDRDRVCYYLCARCGSLQTEAPYWLDQVYAPIDAPDLDTFAGERALLNRAVVHLLFRLCGLDFAADRLLDWGGGTGLLVRLLRDAGIDAHHYDRFERNRYASGFEFDPASTYRFVTAFEVWEHFADPMAELQRLFALDPDFVLVSTCLYDGQGADWDYLGPPKSQHVFFYSEGAMRLVAREWGYRFARFAPHYSFFFRGGVPSAALRVADWLTRHPRWLQVAFSLQRRASRSLADNRWIRAILDSRAGEGERKRISR
jgi:hypothetical protein